MTIVRKTAKSSSETSVRRPAGETGARPPTIVALPGFSGASWAPEQLWAFEGWPVRTMRFPDGPYGIEAHVDHVARAIWELEDFVLVGDSFGALVALALATRRPEGLRALVLSGGFAASPVRNPLRRLALRAARMTPGLLYEGVLLRLHARTVASPFDGEGQIPWTTADTRELFLWNTPHTSYRARLAAALRLDVRQRLGRVEVPTLLVTPAHDPIVGPRAARRLVQGIPDAAEVILPRTGPMFRFTHPQVYGRAIRRFLDARVAAASGAGEAGEGAETAARA